MKRRAYTLVEVLVAMGLVSVLLGGAYGVFHLLFSSKSRSNLHGLTRRSFVQKDAKSGLRRLSYRLREGIQILSPVGGTSANELVFRDLTNSEVRLRHIPAERKVVSERNVDGTWVQETDPDFVNTSGGRMVASWPVLIQNCTDIRFTAISPDCVTVQASLEWEGQVGPLLTVVKLRNSALGY
jgi:prepilin-type N-terminal cleavage/methylation domain-containing protein